MKRDLTALAGKEHDLLIIGGGIYGACVAWDATLRGLSVALIDKGDFGHATSANSLKIIHGGLRYLQDGNLKLVRLMINERKAFIRIAPHLVHPMPCLIPTYKQFTKGKAALSTALAINDLVGFDRNRSTDPQKYLPRGRVISKRECLQLMPGIADRSLTGGAIWYDAQMYNSERVTLSFVLSAAKAGADVANYVEAIGFLQDGNRIRGIEARDVLTSNQLDIRAKLVINTTGPWTEQLLDCQNSRGQTRKFHPSIAMNLITRQIKSKYAIGVPSKYEFMGGTAIPLKKPRILFVAPWRNYSLVGTIHAPFNGCVDDYKVTELEIQNFIDEINAAYPGAALERQDVYFVHSGFLPAQNNGAASRVKLVRQGQICDHHSEQGLDGLITVVGVKYTVARHVAEQVVDLAFKKMKKAAPPCRTHVTSLYGGQIDRFDNYVARETEKRPYGLDAAGTRRLIYNYGSEYPQILKLLDKDQGWEQTVSNTSPVIKAEILHNIRHEMAQKLTDVILRRTDLGSAGWPGEATLRACANITAGEFGWSRSKIEQEIDEVKAVYANTNSSIKKA